MELWELEAREAIRDLVARYNANGDSGRFEQVMALFADDAVMELPGGDRYEGVEAIRTIFTGTRDRLRDAGTAIPRYLRHHTATHQIDVHDTDHATGRSYYLVIMDHGLDHWGRYLDEYERRSGRWVFVRRRVTTDGRVGGSAFGD